MREALLVFTFSPVQPFIAEARRASDLYVGSQILVRLAYKAAKAIEPRGTVIYPALPQRESDLRTIGMPNKIVARVPWEEARGIAEAAHRALIEEWRRIAETARMTLVGKQPLPDETWSAIWDRQTSRRAKWDAQFGQPWEVYWAAAELVGPTPQEAYKTAYGLVDNAVEAVKRGRIFVPSDEPGLKDSFSGRRQALRTADKDATEYWKSVGESPGVTAAELRPGGRERLDALGAIKRFVKKEAMGISEDPFDSTSTVASKDYWQKQAAGRLNAYRQAIAALKDIRRSDKRIHRVRSADEWPYDGDFFYMETLTAKTLKDDYGVEVTPADPVLLAAQDALQQLYTKVGSRPSTYYAIIVLDGDGMGERVNKCLQQPDPQAAHRALSQRLAAFAQRVPTIVDQQLGSLIYNGGDDVLAMAQLSTALPLAQAMAGAFTEAVEDGATASAGIAVVHHLFPLSAALRAAREAESRAKDVEGKAAVCVRVLKRSGETTEVRSPWASMGTLFDKMVSLFSESKTSGQTQGAPLRAPLASKFPYDLSRATYALTSTDEAFASELKRLLMRHQSPEQTAYTPEGLALRLAAWAATLPGKRLEPYPSPLAVRGGAGQSPSRSGGSPPEANEEARSKSAELADWLTFARFVAQGGGE